MTREDFSPKQPAEVKSVTFDFTSDLAVGETISTKSVAASVYAGVDASPSSLVSGAASSSGAVVSQLITGGVAGVIYELACTITTSAGQTLQRLGLLPVVATLP